MYCCQCFTNLINSAGDNGLAILVSHVDGKFRFVLQMRAMSYSDAKTCVKVQAFPEDKAIVLTQSIIIHYCPWCGVLLSDLVAFNTERYKQLALVHELFQDDWK